MQNRKDFECKALLSGTLLGHLGRSRGSQRDSVLVKIFTFMPFCQLATSNHRLTTNCPGEQVQRGNLFVSMRKTCLKHLNLF